MKNLKVDPADFTPEEPLVMSCILIGNCPSRSSLVTNPIQFKCLFTSNYVSFLLVRTKNTPSQGLKELFLADLCSLA